MQAARSPLPQLFRQNNGFLLLLLAPAKCYCHFFVGATLAHAAVSRTARRCPSAFAGVWLRCWARRPTGGLTLAPHTLLVPSPSIKLGESPAVEVGTSLPSALCPGDPLPGAGHLPGVPDLLHPTTASPRFSSPPHPPGKNRWHREVFPPADQ